MNPDIPNIPTAEAQAKAEVLIEALPWMQRFKDAVVVVKLGGNAMVDDRLKTAFAADLAFMRHAGLRPVVVHGGGPQIDAMLERVGIESRFVGGLRYTSPEIMEIARMVLTGQVGPEIVGRINSFYPFATGMSGQDLNLFTASRRRPVRDGAEQDIGLVGDVAGVDIDVITRQLDAGRIPVISSIAPEVDADGRLTGHVLNINADTAAAGIAQAIGAEKLVILTNVEGLYRSWPDRDSLISEITASDLRALLPSLAEGMIPKMEGLLQAVDHGVRTAAVVDGRMEHAVLLEVFTTRGVGTMVKRDDYD